jgi:hypothetical protein
MARRGRKRRGRGLSAYSDAQLQKELARRTEKRIRELKQERAKLDAEIQKIAKAGGGAKVGRGRKARVTAVAAGPKRKRASRAEVRALMDRVQKAVAAVGKAGMNMGALRKAVRGSTLQLRMALKKLMAVKKIKKTGDRRQTKYFAS